MVKGKTYKRTLSFFTKLDTVSTVTVTVHMDYLIDQ